LADTVRRSCSLEGDQDHATKPFDLFGGTRECDPIDHDFFKRCVSNGMARLDGLPIVPENNALLEAFARQRSTACAAFGELIVKGLSLKMLSFNAAEKWTRPSDLPPIRFLPSNFRR